MGLAGGPGSSATLGTAGSQGTAVRWGNGGGVGNVVACHGGGAPRWVPGTVRVRVAAGRPLGSGRGKRPRQERLGPPPEGERSLMSAQAPLTVAQRKRCRAKDTKARRSPIEEPAWVARKLTKRTAPTPRRPPSSLTRAWKAKPWAAACRIHLAPFSTSERRAAWPGVAAAPGQMSAREDTAVRTSVMTL